MLQALEALGAQVEHHESWQGSAESAVRITPVGEPTPAADQRSRTSADSSVEIDCGLAGTVMRFVPTLAAVTGRSVRFTGDREALLRPMGAALAGLRALGAEVTEEGESGRLPFTVRSPDGVEGGSISIDASASSQFVSGLLLSAPRFRNGLTLHHSGTQVPSMEHIEMTLRVLTELGVEASTSAPYTWRVEPGDLAPFTARVEPDLSNAGPFLCAAAVTGGEVTMAGWPRDSTQIGRRWVSLLRDFGCEVTLTPEPLLAEGAPATDRLTVRGPQRLTSPGTVDGTAELTPTVAALAALCGEETKFTSVDHLRGHETDRIAALVTEIRRLGGAAEETPDGFRVLAPVVHGGTVRSYADHRMATFGAVLGLAVEGVAVEDIACTAKTMPDFAGMWERMLA